MKLILAAALAATAVAAVSAPALAQSYGPPPGDWHGQGTDQAPGPGYDHDHGPGGPGYDHDHGPGGPDYDHGPGFQGPGPGGGWDIDHRIDWMQDRINHGRDDGSLWPHAAARAQRSLNSIRSQERHARYRDGGHLSDFDRQGLEQRLDQLNDQLHWMHPAPPRPW